MHIVLGVLGAVVTILILTKRLSDAGYTPSDFNPFLWYRRYKWRQTYETKPLYAIHQPMELAALLLVATAKCDGEISSEQKQEILKLFEDKFHRSQKEASGLLTSSIFLLKDTQDISKELDKIIEPSREQISQQQAESIPELMEYVARIEGELRQPQIDLINAVKQALAKTASPAKQW